MSVFANTRRPRQDEMKEFGELVTVEHFHRQGIYAETFDNPNEESFDVRDASSRPHIRFIQCKARNHTDHTGAPKPNDCSLFRAKRGEPRLARVQRAYAIAAQAGAEPWWSWISVNAPAQTYDLSVAPVSALRDPVCTYPDERMQHRGLMNVPDLRIDRKRSSFPDLAAPRREPILGVCGC